MGIGTINPSSQLELNGALPDVTLTDTSGDSYVFGNNNGTFRIRNTTDAVTMLEISPTTHTVSINNGLMITGGCTGCDAVFSPDWELESIEEHETKMYKNSYLPGVGQTPEGNISINVFEKVTGILQELEKAHIYIAQLNKNIKTLEKRLEEVEPPRKLINLDRQLP